MPTKANKQLIGALILLGSGLAFLGLKFSLRAKQKMNPELIREITSITLGQVPTEEVLQAMQADASSPAALVQRLVASPGFLEETAPEILFGMYQKRNATPFGRPLKSFQLGDDLVYQSRGNCAANDIEEVIPWWDSSKPVKVCKEAHKPDLFKPTESIYCSGVMGLGTNWDEFDCGCGPHLMRCYPAGSEIEKLSAQFLMEEMRKTVTEFVRSDRAVTELYTANETMQNSFIKFIYARQMVEAGLMDAEALLSYDAELNNKWDLSPRPLAIPGNHAGLLTSWQLFHTQINLRQKLSKFFELAYCIEPFSSGVLTEEVLKIKEADVGTGKGWEALAAKPVCTNCHARLDYSGEFLSGFSSSFKSMHLQPEDQAKGDGKFYMANIRDYRGKAELNPQALGRLIVAQPEFKSCVVKKIAHYISRDFTEPDFNEIMAQMGDLPLTLKNVYATSMKKYILDKSNPHGDGSRMGPVQAPPARTVDAPPVDEKVAISDEVREELDAFCVPCHGSRHAIDFSSSRISRQSLIKAATEVSYHLMPEKSEKVPAMGNADRETFLKSMLRFLYPEAADYAAAAEYYLNRLQSDPVFEAGAATKKFATDGRPYDHAYTVESTVQPRYLQLTPSYISDLVIRAHKICENEPNRDACLEQILNPENFLR